MEIDRLRTKATLLLLALACGGPVRAGFDVTDIPPDPHPVRPRFQADASSYRGPNGPEVVLAAEVPYSELFFKPAEGLFRSEFDFLMILRQGKEQVGGDLWPEKVEVAQYADTRSKTSRVRHVVSIPVRPGRYRAEVTLNASAAGERNRLEWDLEVPDYDREPLALSGLWLTECSGQQADSVDVPPHSWLLGRRYGEPLGALCVVGRVYRAGVQGSGVPLQWRILGGRSEVVQNGELTSGADGTFRIRPDFAALWLGQYVFELQARTADEKARRRFEFRSEETMSAADPDPDQSLDLIALIATPEELRGLKEAPPAERKEAWNRFWKKRDPTPETPENEFRNEFFTRVRYANDHYGILGPGWRSDQGRTYIQLGPPDQIESHPYNMDSRPYEIWIYYKLGRRIVFVDYDGFGRYELYTPGRS